MLTRGALLRASLIVATVFLTGCSPATAHPTAIVATTSPVFLFSVPPLPRSEQAPTIGPRTPTYGLQQPDPPGLAPANIYAATASGMLSAKVAGDPYRLYVPDSGGRTVEVIDPVAGKVVAVYRPD